LFGFALSCKKGAELGPTVPQACWIVVNVVVLVLVVKIYFVHVSVGRARHAGNTEALPKWTNITRNDVETFVPLCGVLPVLSVALLVALDSPDPVGFQGASLFFLCLYAVARILFTVFYAIGLQPFRSISFVVGLLSLVLMGWMGTGLISRFVGTEMLTGVNVMVMLDLMRTWIVGTSTAFNRGKAGLVLTEEDRRLPGVKPTTEDTDAALLSQILATIQTKDCQLQLALFFSLHLIGPVIPPGREANGYVAVVALYLISRVAYTVVSVLKLKPLVLSSVAFFSVLMVVVLLLWGIVGLFATGPVQH